MSETDKVFAGSIPELYDTYLVPLIFQGFAADMARRVSSSNPTSVLETAAGSGVVTRALAPRLSSSANYVVTDLNQPMLEHATRLQADDGRITWQQANALELPFSNAEFDVICCQFGVMFFPDRVAAYREARRVLKPGGRFVFNVWDRLEENELSLIVTEAVAALFPGDPPRFLSRTPYAYHEIGTIRTELAGAGFSTMGVDTVQRLS